MKRFIKVNLLIITSFLLLFSVTKGQPVHATDAINEKLGVPIIVYGDTLTAEQREEVRRLLDADQLADYKEYDITGADIAKYIDGDPNSRMFSSAKITRKDKGHGIVVNIVTAENITQVTSDMYANAMLTAGVEDAIVEVVSPVKVTGHSALTGIYKAYDVEGETLDKGRMEVANEELDIATELAEKEGMSQEKVSELLAEIKKEIADKKPATKEEIAEIVKDQLDKLEISLSEEDRQLLINLFEKMRGLNIDFDKVKSQLDDLTSKLKDKFGDIQIDEGFWEKVKNFFRDLFNKIASLFG